LRRQTRVAGCGVAMKRRGRTLKSPVTKFWEGAKGSHTGRGGGT